jgi:adenylylsulfate kinase-like enzyme
VIPSLSSFYASAERGELTNVVGFHIPFVQPVESAIVLKKSGEGLDVEAATEVILSRLKNEFSV